LNNYFFFIFFSVIAIPVQSKCFLGPEFIDSAITFDNRLRAVKSFISYSDRPGVMEFSGAVTSFPLTGKFTALRLEPSSPFKSERQAFIFAVDLPTEQFYTYFTNGVSEPYKNLIKGRVDRENCSIYFKVSDTEELAIKIHGEDDMEIISRGRIDSDQEFTLNQRFVFSSNEHVNQQ